MQTETERNYNRRAEDAGRAFINGLKVGRVCADCGETYPPFCMDFDHVRGIKKKPVSQMGRFSVATILAEVAKCDLVCANCHRVRTESRKGRSQNPHRQWLMGKLNTLKSKPCMDGSRVFAPAAMEFDHTGAKTAAVSYLWTWEKMQMEAAKCDLLCACCHRKRTTARRPTGRLEDAEWRKKQRARGVERRRRADIFREKALPLLGRHSDRHLARQFGVDRTLRERLGIQPYKEGA